MRGVSKKDIKLVQKEFEKMYNFYVRGFKRLPDRDLCGKMYRMLVAHPGKPWEKLIRFVQPIEGS